MYERDERHCEAERQRMSGQADLAMGAKARHAENRFVEALWIARAQGANSLETRAVISLLRLEEEVGEPRGALDKLTTALGSIAKWCSTTDTLEATAMIGRHDALVTSRNESGFR